MWRIVEQLTSDQIFSFTLSSSVSQTPGNSDLCSPSPDSHSRGKFKTRDTVTYSRS